MIISWTNNVTIIIHYYLFTCIDIEFCILIIFISLHDLFSKIVGWIFINNKAKWIPGRICVNP